MPTDIVQLTEEQQEAVALAEAQRALAAIENPHLNTTEWYVGKMKEIEEAAKRVKEHCRLILADLARQRTGIVIRFGTEVKADIDAMLAAQSGKPRKSVMLLTGRAGYRPAKAGIHVTDRKALVAWCVENCPESVDNVLGRKTPVVEHIAATGEIPPGVVPIPAGDVFYPQVTLAALPAGEDADNDD